MLYALLADLVVAIHVGYVSYVVRGALAILCGAWRTWDCVRTRWFRVSHLVSITIVALEAIFNIACPLTVWEERLRKAAGEEMGEGTFVGRLLDKLIFYDLPSWVFTAVYVAFALVVLFSFYLVPVRWRRST